MLNKAQLIQSIVAAGTWNEPDGIGTQQFGEEFADLLLYLQPQAEEFRRYLEIGAAAGGTAWWLNEYLRFDAIYLIDDNAQGKQTRRHTNLPNAIEWIGDSTTQECRDALATWGGIFDLVLIDGGHTYQCVTSDTYLVLPYLRRSSLVMYHDVLGPYTPDVTRWCEELQQGAVEGLTYRRTIGHQLGVGIFEWTGK